MSSKKYTMDDVKQDEVMWKNLVVQNEITLLKSYLQNKDYSKEGRYQNIRNANAIATYSNNILHRDVILALVNPYKHLREELKLHNAHVYQIYLHTKRDVRKEYHVSEFEKGCPNIEINTDKNPHACWLELKSELNNLI